MLRRHFFAPRLPPFDQTRRIRRRPDSFPQTRRPSRHYRISASPQPRPSGRRARKSWRPWHSQGCRHRRVGRRRISYQNHGELVATRRLLATVRKKVAKLLSHRCYYSVHCILASALHWVPLAAWYALRPHFRGTWLERINEIQRKSWGGTV